MFLQGIGVGVGEVRSEVGGWRTDWWIGNGLEMIGEGGLVIEESLKEWDKP